MESISSREAQHRFGEVVDKAQIEPVKITRRDREVAVIVSARRFEELESFEDAYWIAQGKMGEQSGYLSIEESEKFMQEMLSRDEG